jgi:hypothetical protein
MEDTFLFLPVDRHRRDLPSVPFVPPGDAHKMRAFAATIPIMALLPLWVYPNYPIFFRGSLPEICP